MYGARDGACRDEAAVSVVRHCWSKWSLSQFRSFHQTRGSRRAEEREAAENEEGIQNGPRRWIHYPSLPKDDASVEKKCLFWFHHPCYHGHWWSLVLVFAKALFLSLSNRQPGLTKQLNY
jgi:hypothetical protein